ncbi:hypothetical protein HBI71_004980 [Parastagonospora nodorum]|nr:hypothetical protein HBI71_004980 [Parastagonospora nodorum]KAH5414359.1 hypothetical protein HBI47_153210 [Parastagonospora nodorum]
MPPKGILKRPKLPKPKAVERQLLDEVHRAQEKVEDGCAEPCPEVLMSDGLRTVFSNMLSICNAPPVLPPMRTSAAILATQADFERSLGFLSSGANHVEELEDLLQSNRTLRSSLAEAVDRVNSHLEAVKSADETRDALPEHLAHMDQTLPQDKMPEEHTVEEQMSSDQARTLAGTPEAVSSNDTFMVDAAKYPDHEASDRDIRPSSPASSISLTEHHAVDSQRSCGSHRGTAAPEEQTTLIRDDVYLDNDASPGSTFDVTEDSAIDSPQSRNNSQIGLFTDNASPCNTMSAGSSLEDHVIDPPRPCGTQQEAAATEEPTDTMEVNQPRPRLARSTISMPVPTSSDGKRRGPPILPSVDLVHVLWLPSLQNWVDFTSISERCTALIKRVLVTRLISDDSKRKSWASMSRNCGTWERKKDCFSVGLYGKGRSSSAWDKAGGDTTRACDVCIKKKRPCIRVIKLTGADDQEGEEQDGEEHEGEIYAIGWAPLPDDLRGQALPDSERFWMTS